MTPLSFIATLLLLLAVVGLLISSYFTAVAYRWMRPDARWIPPVCRMDEQTCASIVFTPQARVFGLPNSALGQVFYFALGLAVWRGWLGGPVGSLFLGASVLTVGLAVYLSYDLLFVIRVRCVLCLASHIINVAIFALLASIR